MSIRLRLGLALALALTPVLALAGLQAWIGFRSDTHARQTQLVEAAQRSAITARAQVAVAQILLESVTPQTVGFECTPRLAELVTRLKGFSNLVRLDAGGRVQCSARDVRGDPAERRSRPWFQQLEAGEHFVLAPSVATPQPTIIAAERVDGPGGAFEGAVIAGLPLAQLKPDMHDSTLPSATAAALADGAGHLLLASDPRAFAPPAAGGFASHPGTPYTARTPAGELRSHVAVRLLTGPDLFVVLSAPEPGLWSWARLNPLNAIGLPLLAWLLAVGVVWFVTDRTVVRWLGYLDRIAMLYARGRFSVRPVKAERAPAEIRELARTLDAMADAIVSRDRDAREHLAQKDALMREIHHRVKNNLQVITSLLNMQQRSLTDPEARAAMHDTRQRIAALALIYRALYQSPDLRRVDVRQFLEELIAQVVQGETSASGGPVRTELVADDLEIDPDKLAPLALFAVEALTHARKAAAKGGRTIGVRFTVGAEVTLEVEDDGAALAGAAGAPPTGDVGRTLMTAYARQLRGVNETVTAVDGGRVQRLTFPRPDPPPEETGPGDAATSSSTPLRNPLAA